MTTGKPKRMPNIIEQDLGEEVLLYNAAGEVVHILNLSASHIWHCCDGQHTVADIAKELGQTFEVPPGYDLLPDIHGTLEALAQKGLISPGI